MTRLIDDHTIELTAINIAKLAGALKGAGNAKGSRGEFTCVCSGTINWLCSESVVALCDTCGFKVMA